MTIRLVRVDYHDGLGGAMYYIVNSQTGKRECISKDAFNQIFNALKSREIVSVYSETHVTTVEYVLAFE